MRLPSHLPKLSPAMPVAGLTVLKDNFRARFRQASIRLLALALLSPLLPACTNPDIKTMKTMGIATVNWQKPAFSRATWISGPTPAVRAAGIGMQWEASGSLYIDYTSMQASGAGEQSLVFIKDAGALPPGTGTKTVYKIHGMRQIRIDDTKSDFASFMPPNPAIVVFDGDFKVYQIKGGQVGKLLAHSTSAFDRGGPSDAGGLLLFMAPPGIQLSDGVQLGGFLTESTLTFHK